MIPGSPKFTAGELWQLSFTVAGRMVAALLEALDDGPLSVSAFELGDGGVEAAELWRIQLLVAAEPDPRAWQERLADCGAALGLAELTIEPVPATDWLAAVRREHAPIMAGRILVHGSHARDEVPAGALAIEIDAGLAFGSGEHESTRGCLLALDALTRHGRKRRVLDLGCGSAVLAIAAARLWPTARVLAADNDPVAVRVAGENARINRVATRVRVTVSEGYAAPAVARAAPFDLILANILADPLIALAPALRQHLARGGHVVLAGLLDRQAEAVLAAHRRHGLRLLSRHDLGTWTTLVLRG